MPQHVAPPTHQATPDLDHVGIFGRNLDELAAQYQRLGFCLTPMSQHARPPAPGMAPVMRGTANRCAMLEQGYLELLAVVDPALDGLGVPEALARYAGIHILAFGVKNPQEAQARLQDCGFEAVQAELERSLDGPGGAGLARFTQVRTPAQAMPEARVFLLRHETPELLWQKQYLQHPNTARALDEVIVVTDDLAEAAQRYARYLACVPQRSPGLCRYALGAASFTLMEPAAFQERFPQAMVPVLPFPAAIAIRVTDLDSTTDLLVANGVPFQQKANELVVAAQFAGGATLVFTGE